MPLQLPKKYLSYSQINLWLTSKQKYINQYIKGVDKFTGNVHIDFGKSVHEDIENGKLQYVPRFAVPEQKLEVVVDDVPLFGFVDSFCPDTNSLIEFKTGTRKPDGRARWDDETVAKHLQLPIYSVMIEEKYGSVADDMRLVWLEAQFGSEEVEIMGHKTICPTNKLELTGDIHVFRRTIGAKERQETRDLIRKVAEEISEEYASHRR